MSDFNFGIAKVELPTKNAIGFNMQGFADSKQIATGISMPIFSRCFVVQSVHRPSDIIAIVVVDLWS